MADEKGQIAVDFLLGISLFLMALIFTVQFIPGMFMAGSLRESSLDYTAYRTATILTEDTGWWGNSTGSATDWENHPNIIMRVGLAVDNDINSRLTDKPNMLSKNKTIQLMLLNETELTDLLGLYNQVDSTHFAYGYNISLTEDINLLNPVVVNSTPVTLGGKVPSDRETSKITRVVLIETASVGSFDARELPVDPASNIEKAEDAIINITGPLDSDVKFYITNLTVNGTVPQFKELVLDGTKITDTSKYTIYQVAPDGTMTALTANEKIKDGYSLYFVIDSDLFSSTHTYQLVIDMKDVRFTATAPPYPEYTDSIIQLYEPAYLTVEVWQ